MICETSDSATPGELIGGTWTVACPHSHLYFTVQGKFKNYIIRPISELLFAEVRVDLFGLCKRPAQLCPS